MKYLFLVFILTGCDTRYNVVMEQVGNKPWFYCSKSGPLLEEYQILMRSDNVKEVNDYCEKMREKK